MYTNASKILGLPVALVRRAMFYAEKVSTGQKQTDGVFIRREQSRLAKALTPILKEQMQYVVSHLEIIRPYATKDLNSDMDRMLSKLPKDALADRTMSSIQVSFLKGSQRVQSRHKAIASLSFNLRHPEAVAYMRAKQSLLLSDYQGTISAFTNDAVKQIVADGVAQGKTYGEIAKLIEDQGENGVFSPKRAIRIAVNEVGNGYVQGQVTTTNDFIRRTGAVLEKAWNTAGDEKVDPDICKANEAQGWIPYNSNFQSGDFAPLGHINCVLPDTMVLPCGGVFLATERHYEGDVVKISTRNQSLTLTPNHPVLTDVGWKAAKDIQVSDNVIIVHGEPGIVQDYKDTPAKAQEIGSSLRVSSMSMPFSTPDFHGDSFKSNINIIFTDLFFQNANREDLFKKFIEQYGSLRGPDFIDDLLSSDSPLNQMLKTLFFSPHGRMSTGDLLFSLFRSHAAPFDLLGLGTISDSDFVIDKYLANTLPRDAVFLTQLQYGHQTLVRTDNITAVHISKYSGSVYNFHTESGYYISNSIVTHNCRCNLIERVLSLG